MKGNKTLLSTLFLYHSSSCHMALSVCAGGMCWDVPAGNEKVSFEGGQTDPYWRADFQGVKG